MEENMKKLLCIMMACAFILGGCGSKTEKMVCKYNEDEINSENTFEYKDDNVIKQTTVTKLSTKDAGVDKDQLKSVMKATKKMYDIEGITYDYEIKKDYVKTTSIIDYEKVKIKDLVDLGLINEFDENGKKIKRVSLKLTKESLKGIGYKCK